MSQAKYFEAPDVKQIADDLIQKYHQHLIDYDIKIRYIFTDKTPNSGGKEVWGSCRKISGINAYLESEDSGCEPFFVITISKDIWDVLPKDKKIALVDHELCHAVVELKKSKKKENQEDEEEMNPDFKIGVKPHDLEEFSCIVRRHGLWRDDIKDFVESALKSKNKES
jgi:predicted metallopeptidase